MKVKPINYFLKSFDALELIGKNFNVYDICGDLIRENCYINEDGYVCCDSNELWSITMGLLTGLYSYEIIPKKKKLRDLTEEEYNKWQIKNCEEISNCKGCLFDKVICQKYVRNCWLDHKDLYSDKFLNQEIEVEE